MSDPRDAATGYAAATLQAIEAADLPGVEWRLQIAGIELAELRELIEKSGGDLHQAVALAWRAGYLCASIENRAVRQALDAAREKGQAAKRWQQIYLLASTMGWQFPLDRDPKSVVQRLFMQQTGLTARTFRRHYRVAEHHALQFQADEEGRE